MVHLFLLVPLLMTLLMNELSIQHRFLTVGDFNLDQLLPDNVANIAILIKYSKFQSVTAFAIFNITREILDLVFDSSNSNIASVLP